MLLDPTLDGVDERGLLVDIDTLHLDHGYDDEDRPSHRRLRHRQPHLLEAAPDGNAKGPGGPPWDASANRTDQLVAHQLRNYGGLRLETRVESCQQNRGRWPLHEEEWEPADKFRDFVGYQSSEEVMASTPLGPVEYPRQDSRMAR